MGTFPSYILEGLSPENCLSLFVKWAFKEGEEDKYPNLVEIGKEIVKKCRGVPLAIRTLVEDFGFTSVQITQLWVALGLLQSQNGNQRLEIIARDYIVELKSRSFLQDFEDFGHFYYFKVHDLVHDLALYVAKDECVTVDSNTRNISQQVRHLSIVENGSLDSVLLPKSRNVRTLLFPIEGVGLESLPLYILPKLEALLVIDCERLDSRLLVNQTCQNSTETWRVTFLHFENNFQWLQTLSTWIEGAAQTLQTLIIKKFPVLRRLPECLTRMTRLKMLHVVDCRILHYLPSGMQQLTALEALTIDGCPILCRKCEPIC